ncbi:uncharacterized protein Ir51b [Drosophila tropicalis]|uniref:uncharacterized protein Ir51b n=1 Tax=Drosophila tropicalis TaxID=46794 RepID=UPI0035ABDF77
MTSPTMFARLLLYGICIHPWSRSEISASTHNMSYMRSILKVLAEGQEAWTNTPIFRGRHVNQDELEDLIRWLQLDLEVATYLFTTSQPPKETDLLAYQVSNTSVLTLLFCRSSEELIWYHLDKRMWHLRRSRLIVSLPAERSGSYKALLTIFQKIWHFQFLNVLVVHKEKIYGYTPYPKVNYFEIKFEGNKRLFPGTSSNYQGYTVSTPVENDLPRVFFVRDRQTNERYIRGFAYRLFVEFLRQHNATLHVTNSERDHSPTSSVNMSWILQLIEKKEVEISVHAYFDWEMGDSSYPLLITANCLIVPVRNEIPRYMYLYRPFHWHSWLLLLVALIYISGILFGFSGRRSISQSFLQSLCHLLFIGNSTRVYRPSWRYFFVIMQLALLGFIITNWYGNELGSFLTTLLVDEQVDNMEQVVEKQQKILVKKYEVSTLLRHVKPPLIDHVARLVVGVNASEQVTALLSFNRSYAYPFTLERWEFLKMQQQYAVKPLFRFSGACLGSPVIGYPMRMDSHFESPLKYFIMRIQAMGLIQHWLISDFNDALKAGYVHLINNDLPVKALDMDSMRLAWLVLLFGWLMAIFCFICERRLQSERLVCFRQNHD